VGPPLSMWRLPWAEVSPKKKKKLKKKIKNFH